MSGRNGRFLCLGANKTLSFAGVVLATGFLTASHGMARDLADELSFLFDNHPQYQEALDNFDAAEALVDNAFASFLPQASLSAGKGFEAIDSPARRSTGSGSSHLSNENATLTVTMPLFTGFANEANFDTARRDVQIARSTLDLTGQTLALGGISSYILAKRSSDALTLADESVRAIEQQVEAQQALLDTGAGIQLDLLLAQSALQDVKAARAALKSELSAAVAQYTQFFGRAPDLASMEKIEAPAAALPESLDRAIEIAVASHPTIAVAGFQIERASDQVRAARSTLYPQISVTGTANHESNVSGTRGTQNDVAILVQGTWQLFDGFGTAARTSAAQSQASAAKNRNRFAHRQIAQDTEIAWGQFEAATETFSLFAEAAFLAQEVVNAQAELVETGRETEIVLLQAQTAALDRERALIIAESDRSLASLQLLFAMGQLTQDLFGAPEQSRPNVDVTPPVVLDDTLLEDPAQQLAKTLPADEERAEESELEASELEASELEASNGQAIEEITSITAPMPSTPIPDLGLVEDDQTALNEVTDSLPSSSSEPFILPERDLFFDGPSFNYATTENPLD